MLATLVDVAHRAGATLRIPFTRVRDDHARWAEAAGPRLDDPPRRFMAVNDAMALGAVHRLGGQPPRTRPAIVGFDDIAGIQSNRPLTTVRVDARRGRERRGATPRAHPGG